MSAHGLRLSIGFMIVTPVRSKRGWRSDLEIISSRATSHPSVSAEIIEPSGHTPPVPRLLLRWEKSVIALTGVELREKLLASDPRVMIDDIGQRLFGHNRSIQLTA